MQQISQVTALPGTKLARNVQYVPRRWPSGGEPVVGYRAGRRARRARHLPFGRQARGGVGKAAHSFDEFTRLERFGEDRDVRRKLGHGAAGDHQALSGSGRLS